MTWWLFWKVIVRRNLQAPLRCILMCSALAVATTLWLSVATVGFSGVSLFGEAIEGKQRNELFVISPVFGAFSPTFISRCISPMVQPSQDSFLRGGTILVLSRRVGEILVGGRSYKQVRVFGVAGEGAMSGFPAASTAISNVDFTAQDLALHPTLFKSLIHSTRDEPVELQIGTKQLSLNISKLNPYDHGFGDDVIAMPLSSLAAFEAGVTSKHTVDSIYLAPSSAAETLPPASQLRRWLDSCKAPFEPSARVESSQQFINRQSSLMNAYQTNVFVLGLMTLLVSCVIIAHSAQIGVVRLHRELSLLKTLGISPSTCGLLVVVESLFFALLGVLVALTAGGPVTTQLTSYLLSTAHDIYRLSLNPELSLSQRMFVVVGVVALILIATMAGACVSALKTRQIPLAGTTKRFTRAAVTFSSQLLGIVGALLAVTLIVAGGVGHSAVVDSLTGDVEALKLGRIAAYLFLFAAIGCSLILSPVFSCFLLRLLQLGENNRRVSAVMIAARRQATITLQELLGSSVIALSITLIVSVSIMVGSFRTTLSTWLVKRLHGDIFISVDLSGEKGAESKISDELLERVRHTTGVGEIRNYRELASDYHGSPALLGATQVASLLTVNAYDLVRVIEFPTAFSPLGHALVSESGARKLGVELGGELYIDKKTAQISSIPSQAEDSRVKVTVYAVIREFGTEQPLFVIDEALFTRMFPDHGSENMTMLAATDRTGIQPQQLKEILSEKLPGSLVVRDQNELREFALGMFDKTFLITGAVRWIVFSLALVGVLLTVAQRLWENREDYKLIRILGFSRIAVARVVTVQMLPNVLGSICAGLLTGVLAGWALIALVNPTSFGWTLTFHLTVEPFIVAGLFLVVTLMTMSVMALVVTRAVIDPLPISKE